MNKLKLTYAFVILFAPLTTVILGQQTNSFGDKVCKFTLYNILSALHSIPLPFIRNY